MAGPGAGTEVQAGEVERCTGNEIGKTETRLAHLLIKALVRLLVPYKEEVRGHDILS